MKSKVHKKSQEMSHNVTRTTNLISKYFFSFLKTNHLRTTLYSVVFFFTFCTSTTSHNAVLENQFCFEKSKLAIKAICCTSGFLYLYWKVMFCSDKMAKIFLLF